MNPLAILNPFRTYQEATQARSLEHVRYENQAAVLLENREYLNEEEIAIQTAKAAFLPEICRALAYDPQEARERIEAARRSLLHATAHHAAQTEIDEMAMTEKNWLNMAERKYF